MAEHGPNCLLELLCPEEIPARMQRRAIEDLTRADPRQARRRRDPGGSAARLCDAAPPGGHRRRHPRPPARPHEERRGPRVGAPQAGARRLPARRRPRLDRPVRDPRHRPRRILFRGHRAPRPAPPPRSCRNCCAPRSANCRGPNRCAFRPRALRWVRPLISVICLFDGEVLPLPLDQVPVGRMTRGHRFLSRGRDRGRGRRRLSRTARSRPCDPRPRPPPRR